MAFSGWMTWAGFGAGTTEEPPPDPTIEGVGEASYAEDPSGPPLYLAGSQPGDGWLYGDTGHYFDQVGPDSWGYSAYPHTLRFRLPEPLLSMAIAGTLDPSLLKLNFEAWSLSDDVMLGLFLIPGPAAVDPDVSYPQWDKRREITTNMGFTDVYSPIDGEFETDWVAEVTRPDVSFVGAVHVEVRGRRPVADFWVRQTSAFSQWKLRWGVEYEAVAEPPEVVYPSIAGVAGPSRRGFW